MMLHIGRHRRVIQGLYVNDLSYDWPFALHMDFLIGHCAPSGGKVRK